jgi:hypothetical protein
MCAQYLSTNHTAPEVWFGAVWVRTPIWTGPWHPYPCLGPVCCAMCLAMCCTTSKSGPEWLLLFFFSLLSNFYSGKVRTSKHMEREDLMSIRNSTSAPAACRQIWQLPFSDCDWMRKNSNSCSLCFFSSCIKDPVCIPIQAYCLCFHLSSVFPFYFYYPAHSSTLPHGTTSTPITCNHLPSDLVMHDACEPTPLVHT